MIKNKYKLTKTVFALALLTSIPNLAYAEENVNVEYQYNGDLITMINPTYWNYDYNSVKISTTNTEIRLTKQEFEELLNQKEENIIIEDEGSTVIYNKENLINQSKIAETTYTQNGEILKKIIINGGVTIIIIVATGLCIFSENKTKKLK